MVDMRDQWRHMDEMVAMTPMPQEYRDFRVEILCADCHERSSCVFHVVGLKCGACGSYNTARTGAESAPDSLPSGTAPATAAGADAAAGANTQEMPPDDAASGP